MQYSFSILYVTVLQHKGRNRAKNRKISHRELYTIRERKGEVVELQTGFGGNGCCWEPGLGTVTLTILTALHYTCYVGFLGLWTGDMTIPSWIFDQLLFLCTKTTLILPSLNVKLFFKTPLFLYRAFRYHLFYYAHF